MPIISFEGFVVFIKFQIVKRKTDKCLQTEKYIEIIKFKK